MRKLTQKEALNIATIAIALLAALGLITACTNSLFVLKGQNKVKTENNSTVKADSTSVIVGTNKNN